MKKPLSSFSSPSSSSYSCSNGRTTAGCISRILHRILCFSNLPLCSFDRFNEEKKAGIGSSSRAPGLVARLMGLEALPCVEETPLMSSSDLHEKSPRISIPAYQELQDENFFILSFERKKLGKNSMGEKCRKQSTRRRDCVRGKNKENGTEKIDSKGNLEFDFRSENPGNMLPPLKRCCKNFEKTRTTKANEEIKLSFETEGDSENSSPNSVLEFVGFTTDQESASSAGEISRLGNSKMRRPLSDELENCGDSREKEAINNGDAEKEKISSRVRNKFQNYAEKWDEIEEVAAMETVKSSWLDEEMSRNRNCFMEIGRDLECSILDQLLNELLINLQNF